MYLVSFAKIQAINYTGTATHTHTQTVLKIHIIVHTNKQTHVHIQARTHFCAHTLQADLGLAEGKGYSQHCILEAGFKSTPEAILCINL